jgi:hypothetical protein
MPPAFFVWMRVYEDNEQDNEGKWVWWLGNGTSGCMEQGIQSGEPKVGEVEREISEAFCRHRFTTSV